MKMLFRKRSQRGIFPIIIEIESVKATQLNEIKNVTATPPKGIESVHSVPFYNTESHQPLYLKEIFI